MNISNPLHAIKYWRERAARLGSNYASRGARGAERQTKRIKAEIEPLLAGSEFLLGLDYGCGNGRFTATMANYCNQVVGVDFVSCFEQQELSNAGFYQLEYPVRIPYADSSVNLLFVILVLQHIISDEWFDETTAEIRRVLAPGATVLVVDDLVSPAEHVRRRSCKVLCEALGVTTAVTTRALTIDEAKSHQLIFGRTAEAKP